MEAGAANQTGFGSYPVVVCFGVVRGSAYQFTNYPTEAIKIAGGIVRVNSCPYSASANVHNIDFFCRRFRRPAWDAGHGNCGTISLVVFVACLRRVLTLRAYPGCGVWDSRPCCDGQLSPRSGRVETGRERTRLPRRPIGGLASHRIANPNRSTRCLPRVPRTPSEESLHSPLPSDDQPDLGHLERVFLGAEPDLDDVFLGPVTARFRQLYWHRGSITEWRWRTFLFNKNHSPDHRLRES